MFVCCLFTDWFVNSLFCVVLVVFVSLSGFGLKAVPAGRIPAPLLLLQHTYRHGHTLSVFITHKNVFISSFPGQSRRRSSWELDYFGHIPLQTRCEGESVSESVSLSVSQLGMVNISNTLSINRSDLRTDLNIDWSSAESCWCCPHTSTNYLGKSSGIVT